MPKKTKGVMTDREKKYMPKKTKGVMTDREKKIADLMGIKGAMTDEDVEAFLKMSLKKSNKPRWKDRSAYPPRGR
jgi:hypothetical protein